MYYLAKFCRICIQTSENLVDIEENDFDSIKFSEKLKACTEMVITRESLSTQICLQCVNKLRISYQFRNMCKNSTSILQQYLTKLLSSSNKVTSDNFFNSELQVTLTSKLPRRRRKRVGKEERCSLLRKLLSKITHDQFVYNVHIKELSSLCDRIPSPPHKAPLNENEQEIPKQSYQKTYGGLRNLLSFTKNFDFGYDISNYKNFIKNVDLTPLEKLMRFTDTFFYDHFSDFRESVLLIKDNVDFDSSDDECMFDDCNETFEEVHVKQEYISSEPPINIKSEAFVNEDYDSDYDITSSFVQACYEDVDDSVKKENASPTYIGENKNLAEIIPIATFSVSHNNNSPLLQSYLQQPPLYAGKHNQFSFPINNLRKQRTFWPYSIKCRTRGSPFINAQLKDQFQAQSFKCTTCSRQFKSIGYLKAHCSKLRH